MKPARFRAIIPSQLVLGALAPIGHFNETGLKPRQYLDEILLCGHDGVDVLVDHGHFIESGGEEGDAPGIEKGLGFFPAEGFFGLGAAHHTPRAMRGGLEGFGLSPAPDDVSRGRHRSGDDADRAFTRRGGALAMHDEFFAVVPLFPGEVVVVLDIEQDLRAEVLRDMPVDQRMIGRRLRAHELHGRPILPPLFTVEFEPG